MPEPTNGTPGAGASGGQQGDGSSTPPNAAGGGAGAGTGAGAGQPPANAAGARQPGGDDRVFSQADVDRIVGERVAREKTTAAALKEKADAWDKYQETQKSEQQKRDEALAQAQKERDEALSKAQTRLIRAAFIAEAAKAGVAHPEDVYALADLSKISLTDTDDVVGVADAVQAVVKAGRVPLAQNRQAPSLDAGAGNHDKTQAALPQLSEEEITIARKIGITPEKYAASKAKSSAFQGR